MDRISSHLLNLYFWLQVIAGLAIWYVCSCGIARAMVRAGEKPFAAARKGLLWGWFLILVVVPVIATVVWDDLLLTGLLAAAMAVIPLVIILVLIQTAREVDE